MVQMDRFQFTDEQKTYILTMRKVPVLTPAQMDDRLADDFKLESFKFGVQYFGAARFAMAAGFLPAGPSILHHSVEYFMLGCLSIKDTAAQIRNYRNTYKGHNLLPLWAELKSRYPKVGLAAFHRNVSDLSRFRQLRFPLQIVPGGRIQIGVGQPSRKQTGAMRVPHNRDFALDFQAIDALIPKFFQIAEMNPRFFDYMFKHVQAEKFFTLRNATPP
jgi:hypothetical protein